MDDWMRQFMQSCFAMGAVQIWRQGERGEIKVEIRVTRFGRTLAVAAEGTSWQSLELPTYAALQAMRKSMKEQGWS